MHALTWMLKGRRGHRSVQEQSSSTCTHSNRARVIEHTYAYTASYINVCDSGQNDTSSGTERQMAVVAGNPFLVD